MRGFLISGKCLTFYGYLNTALSVNIEDDPLIPTAPQPRDTSNGWSFFQEIVRGWKIDRG